MGNKRIETVIEDSIHKELTNSIVKDSNIHKVQIDTNGELTENDVRHAMDEFIRYPSLSGFDSDMRLVILFIAVQQSIENSQDNLIRSSTCDLCSKRIDSESFAISFIESYTAEKINQKTSIKIGSIKSMANIALRRWKKAIRENRSCRRPANIPPAVREAPA